MFEIRPTETRATCGGIYGRCETYKDHPDWPNLVKQNRHIPKGEMAVFVAMGGVGHRNYCLCKVHAKELFSEMKEILAQAQQLGLDNS